MTVLGFSNILRALTIPSDDWDTSGEMLSELSAVNPEGANSTSGFRKLLPSD